MFPRVIRSHPRIGVWILSVCSGLLFSLGWCSKWFGWLLLVYMVPMFYVCRIVTVGRCGTSPFRVYVEGLCLGSLVASLGTVWWIYHATAIGLLCVLGYHMVFYGLPWCVYYFLRMRSGSMISYMGFVASWLSLEQINLDSTIWQLSFPWLSLGHGLAALTSWIQWYEYTGVLGGSLWICLVNVLTYHALFLARHWHMAMGWIASFLMPLSFGLYRYHHYSEQGKPVEAVVIQPNFDNYTERNIWSSSYVPIGEQIQRFIQLSRDRLSATTQLLVWPETSLNLYLDVHSPWSHRNMEVIANFLGEYPNLQLLTGVSTSTFEHGLGGSHTDGGIEKKFNSALFIKASCQTDIYHKIKLLPFAEYIPYMDTIPMGLRRWILAQVNRIAGIVPDFSPGRHITLFRLGQSALVAPIICYESLYSSFIGQFCNKGAQLLAIITNDGWWGDTSIYHQHFQFSRLLAIAHRRSVVRSATTGISGFISQRGDIIERIPKLVSQAAKQVVLANDQLTFYTLHGNYLGCLAKWIVVLLVVLMATTRWQGSLWKRNS